MPIITRYSRPRTSQAMKKMPSAAPNFLIVKIEKAAQTVKGAYNDRRSRRRNAVRQDA